MIEKSDLLKTDCFLDNGWLDKYLTLVRSGSLGRTVDQYYGHHVVPVSYFAEKLNVITAKQRQKLHHLSSKPGTYEYDLITKDNLVYFSFYQHCLAHYYLFNCTTDDLKYNNEKAFNRMLDQKLKLEKCSEAEIKELLGKKELLAKDPHSKAYLYRQIDKIILDNYPDHGYRLCQKLIKEKLGIDYVEDRIKARARGLQVRSKAYLPPWPKEEEQVVIDNYEKFGYRKCLELLPNRTKTNIQAKAKQLGLTAPRASKKNAAWQPEELEIIKKYYPIGGTRLCKKYLPKRTSAAIKAQANVTLKIFIASDTCSKPHLSLGKAKAVYLIENKKIKRVFKSTKEAAEALNLSQSAISLRCNHRTPQRNSRYVLAFESDLGDLLNGD